MPEIQRDLGCLRKPGLGFEKCGLFLPKQIQKWGERPSDGTHLCLLLLLEKVQEEIGTIVQSGNQATYEDRKNMPFTNAVIHEVQRFITLLPHVPRCTSVDTHFRGYFLPKVCIAFFKWKPLCSALCQMNGCLDAKGQILPASCE